MKANSHPDGVITSIRSPSDETGRVVSHAPASLLDAANRRAQD